MRKYGCDHFHIDLIEQCDTILQVNENNIGFNIIEDILMDIMLHWAAMVNNYMTMKKLRIVYLNVLIQYESHKNLIVLLI